MRRYKTVFYKEEWSVEEGRWIQNDLKTIYIYAFSFDQADRIAHEKLESFQDEMQDTKIKVWMHAIGERVVDAPFTEEGR